VTQADIDNGGSVNPALAYNNTGVGQTKSHSGPNGDPDANDRRLGLVHIVQDRA